MSADLITRLIEAGAPAALVAEVAMLAARAEASGDAIEKRRAADRSRQSKRRGHDVSRDVTLDDVTPRDVTGEPPALDKENLPPTPPIKEINPTPARNTGAPAREPPREEPAPADRTAKRRWPKDMPPPAGVSDEGWAGFVDHRRAKREPLTPRAYQLLCTKLGRLAEDGWPPGELIDTAVERGWTTVFEPKDPSNANRPRRDRPDKPSGWAPRPGMEGTEPAYLDD